MINVTMHLNQRSSIIRPNRLARIERNLQYINGKYYLDNIYCSWVEIVNLVLILDKQIDLVLHQTLLSPMPNHFKRRLAEPFSLGIDYGYQENNKQCIHLKVMQNGDYHIHWESRDPNDDPIGHLIHDASHWLVIISIVILGGLIAAQTARK